MSQALAAHSPHLWWDRSSREPQVSRLKNHTGDQGGQQPSLAAAQPGSSSACGSSLSCRLADVYK